MHVENPYVEKRFDGCKLVQSPQRIFLSANVKDLLKCLRELGCSPNHRVFLPFETELILSLLIPIKEKRDKIV